VDVNFGCVQDQLDRVERRRRARSGGVRRSFGGAIGTLRGLVVPEDREHREDEEKRATKTRKGAAMSVPKASEEQ
jgi:hypothetical protein